MKKILCTFLATIFLSFSFYSSVNAAEASAFSLNSTTTESITIDEDIIQKTDPFISLNDNGQFYITDLNEIKTVLSSDELSIVQNKISETNSALSEMNVSSSSLIISTDTNSISYISSSLVSRSNKEGVNKIEWKWFGARIFLSKSTVTHLLNLGVAAGATYLTIQFPGVGIAVATAIIAFLTTEFATSKAARAIYIDLNLNIPNLINPGWVEITGFGLQ